MVRWYFISTLIYYVQNLNHHHRKISKSNINYQEVGYSLLLLHQGNIIRAFYYVRSTTITKQPANMHNGKDKKSFYTPHNLRGGVRLILRK